MRQLLRKQLSHLYSGIHSRLYAAQQRQYKPIAIPDAGIHLGGRQQSRFEIRMSSAPKPAEIAVSLRDQHALQAVEPLAARKGVEQRATKLAALDGGIKKRARSVTGVYLGDQRIGILVLNNLRFIAAGRSDWNQITIRIAAREFHPDHYQDILVRNNRDHLRDLDHPYAAIFRPEPPARCQKPGQYRGDSFSRIFLPKVRELGNHNYRQPELPGFYGRSRHRNGNGALFERKPEERIGPECQRIIALAHDRKIGTAEHFDRSVALILMQIELHRLRETRKIGNHQNGLFLITPEIGQHALIRRKQKFERAAPKRLVLLPQRNQAFRPAQKRVRILLLRLNVDRFIVISRIDIYRKVE